jgi:hypothetical protein
LARQRRYVVFSVGALAVLGGCFPAVDLFWPHRAKEDAITRQFASWLWNEYGRDADLFCAREDLGLDFLPKSRLSGVSAVYLCHRQMYCRSTASGHKPRNLDLISGTRASDRPVRVVFLDDVPRDNPRCAHWLAAMKLRYQPGPQSVFAVHPGSPTLDRERYVVLEFSPKGPLELAARALGADSAMGGQAVRR